MARLKKIKNNLGSEAKKVIDSLIDNGKKNIKKEQDHESIRGKVEIFEGANKKILADSFVVNTTNLEKTISDIEKKYGKNVEFTILNLYDEKIVAKRSAYTNGYGREKEDKIHYNHQIDIFRRLQKMKEEGKSIDEICIKLSTLAARSYLTELYNKSEVEIKQKLRNDYNNQSLGINDDVEILSESIDTKEDISNNGDHDKENIDSGDNNEE